MITRAVFEQQSEGAKLRLSKAKNALPGLMEAYRRAFAEGDAARADQAWADKEQAEQMQRRAEVDLLVLEAERPRLEAEEAQVRVNDLLPRHQALLEAMPGRLQRSEAAFQKLIEAIKDACEGQFGARDLQGEIKMLALKHGLPMPNLEAIGEFNVAAAVEKLTALKSQVAALLTGHPHYGRFGSEVAALEIQREKENKRRRLKGELPDTTASVPSLHLNIGKHESALCPR